MSRGLTTGTSLSDVPDLKVIAERLRSHLLNINTFFDFGSAENPTYERALFQLVFRVNSQNYFTTLGLLETDHVILAGHSARALLEESIRWEWMTDEPETRLHVLIGELRRNLKNINAACASLGVDPTPFLNPSPFWNTDALKPFEGAKGFPSIEAMLHEIQTAGDDAARASGIEVHYKIKNALYAQYRVLSQLTHTSVLGMIASMQYEDGLVSVANRVPQAILALILQCAVASVVNISAHTAKFFVDETQDEKTIMEWIMNGYAIASDMAEAAGPRHGLTTF